MTYVAQTWADNDPSKPVSAARIQHIEDGLAAVANGGSISASGDVTLTSDNAGGGSGDVVIVRNTNKLLAFTDIGGANKAAAIAFYGTNGLGVDGRAWSMGVDVAATPADRDFFIAKTDWPAAGNVFDSFYIANRGAAATAVPTILIGNSSMDQTLAGVAITQAADGTGAATDTGLANLLLRVANTLQTQPALAVKKWTSATNLFQVEVDGGLSVFNTGGTQQWQVKPTTGITNIGQDAVGNTTDTVRIKPNAADATVRIASTSGGSLLITAANGSATVSINTSNASILTFGTNSVTALSIAAAAATKGVVTHTPTPTLAAGAADIFLHTLTPVVAGAFTLDRLDYLQLQQPTGAATVTDAAALSFNAAIGTHKAVAAGTTKTSPGTVTAWIKININGTLHYMPAYASQTT